MSDHATIEHFEKFTISYNYLLGKSSFGLQLIVNINNTYFLIDWLCFGVNVSSSARDLNKSKNNKMRIHLKMQYPKVAL